MTLQGLELLAVEQADDVIRPNGLVWWNDRFGFGRFKPCKRRATARLPLSPIVRARGARDTIGISCGRKAEARYDRKWKSDAESELVVVIFESVVINVVPPALFASES